ncbi:MAG: ABC transporter substrate-binding protein [Gammaproteobacteria bacterium]|nr:ABC transporter substrate-binding protein [Gammaproteobacteria bacterium]
MQCSGRATTRAKVRARVIRGALLLLLALLQGCTLEPQHPFRVGTNVWVGYEPLYLARQLGYYDDTPIRLVELPNASEVIQALRNGVLEAAALTLDEALTLVEDEYDLRIVLVFDFSHGGDALLAKPDIATLQELRGKRIAVESTAVGAVMLEAALDAAGLTLADISLLPATVDRHMELYRDGSADALVTFDPVRSRLLALGARSLFDSSQIPSRIVDVLVVRREVLPKDGTALRQLLAGYFEALEYQRKQPELAAQRMSTRLGLNADEAMVAFRGLHRPGVGENRSLLAGAQQQALMQTLHYLTRLLSRQKRLSTALPTQSLLDAQWLPRQ